MNNFIIELHNWMTTNYLYLHTNISTLINITNNLFHFLTIYFENTAQIPHNSTIYLGVTITNELRLKYQ